MLPNFITFVYELIEKYFSIQAKCIVHFRPERDWEGKGYGFDWMRIKDTNLFGDKQPYKKIVGKLYDPKTGGLEMDFNKSEGDFKAIKSCYESLESEYMPLIIPWKFTIDKKTKEKIYSKYYCSWLCLYPEKQTKLKLKISPSLIPLLGTSMSALVETVEEATGFSNTSAELRLRIEIQEEPDYLEFEENPYFKISPMKITEDLKKGKRWWNKEKTIKIDCKKDFMEDQQICIFAYKKDEVTGENVKKLAGKLYVWANYFPRIKKVKALLVSVTTPTTKRKGTPNKGDTSGQESLFKRYLNQALIDVEPIYYDLDLDADTAFKKNGKFRDPDDQTRLKYSKEGSTVMCNHLNDKIKEQLKKNGEDENKYDNLFKAYYFDEKDAEAAGFLDLNSWDVVLFKGRSEQTAPHEFLHRFKLSHSFANDEASGRWPIKATYTYKYYETENLMDYSHRVGKARYSLWYWQWKIANDEAK